MSSSPFYVFEIVCADSEGNLIKTEVGSREAPTACPHGGIHEVRSIIQYGKIDPGTIKVTDTTPENAYFQCTTIPIPIPSTTQIQKIVVEKSYPFDMVIWELGLASDVQNIGDVLNVEIGPDTPIGVLTTAASKGSTTISVTPTVFPVVVRGCEIGLISNHGIEKIGLLTNVDPVTSTLSFEDPLSQDYPPGTVISFSLYPVKDLIIDSSQRITIGTKGLKSKTVPAGTVIRFTYTDNTPRESISYAYFQVQYYRY